MEEEIIRRVQLLYLDKIVSELKCGINKEILVKGFSMVPTIEPFQRVQITPCNINSVYKGQIVAYKLEEHPWITIHRAIEIIKINSKSFLRTKGDHMQHPDKYIVSEDTFLGIVSLIMK